MGIALWLVSGMAAFLLARFVPFGRTSARLAELGTGILVALALGILSTALDFGGWKELDWRAGAFAFAGTFGAIGLVRAGRR